MATPSAILSVLVEANASAASATLSKFDKQLAAVNDVAKKGIQARLGGTLNTEAFTAYEERLSRAARIAKDREAFKAQLGANFNNSAFNSYERSIDKANRASDSAGVHTSRLSGSFRTLARSVLAAGGVFAAFEAGKNAIESTTQLGHATERLSAITGMDVKSSSQWIEIMKVRNVAARQTSFAFITLAKNIKAAEDGSTKSSASVQALTKKQGDALATLTQRQQDHLALLQASGASQASITRTELSQQLALAAMRQSQAAALDAVQGSTVKAAAALKELGVSQAAIQSGNLTEVTKEIADGLSKIENPAQRAALAQQLFGRGAQGLIPILKDGSKGIDQALASAQRYGAYLPNSAKQLDTAVESQRNLNLAMDGLKISFTQAVLPSLVKGAQALLGFIAQMRSGKGAGGEFASAISTAFNTAKSVIQSVIDVAGGLKPALEIALGALAASRIFKVGRELAGIAETLRKGPGKIASLWRVGEQAAGGGLAKVTSSVATMEVAEMIVRNMVGGTPGSGGGVTPAPTPAGRTTGAAGLRGAILDLGKFAGVAGIAGVLGPQLFHRGGLGALPTSIKTTAGATSWLQSQGVPADLAGAFAGSIPGLRSGPQTSRAITQLTLDSRRAQLALTALGSDGTKAFTAVSRAARQANDTRFALADRLAADMLKAKGVTRNVTGEMLATLRTLPPAARTAAANTAIGLAAELEAKGRLPKGSAEQIRRSVTDQFRHMRVDSIAQAEQLVTGVAGKFDWLAGRLDRTMSRARASIAGVFSHIIGQVAGSRQLGQATDIATQAATAKQASSVSSALAAAEAAASAAAGAKAARKAQQQARQAVPPAPTPIPSQLVGAQTRMAQIANALQAAQNAASTIGQTRALSAELKLEHGWLTADRTQLDRVNAALAAGHVSLAKHKQLLQDKLAILQEIGNVISNIGSTQTSLTGVAGVGATLPKVYYHDRPRTGRAPRVEQTVKAGVAKGIGRGGVTIGQVVVNGNNMNERQMMDELYLKIRPHLIAPV